MSRRLETVLSLKTANKWQLRKTFFFVVDLRALSLNSGQSTFRFKLNANVGSINQGPRLNVPVGGRIFVT